MSVLGPVCALIISFVAHQAHASLHLSRGGEHRNEVRPVTAPLTAFAQNPPSQFAFPEAPPVTAFVQDATAPPVTAFAQGPCQCDSFCTGVRAAQAQPVHAGPPPPPPSGWGPSGMSPGVPLQPPPAQPIRLGMNQPASSSVNTIGMRQQSGRLAVRSLISLESRPRSEAAREALLHGASASLMQQYSGSYEYLSQGTSDAQQQSPDPVGHPPLGPRREPGMHCNCHCNHDPWFYMRGTAPPIDWSLTPPPPTVLPAPPPCSGTSQEWPGCPAPRKIGLHMPLGGLPGLPKLLPVTSDDLPTLGPAPGVWAPGDGPDRPSDVTGPPPGPPPEPQRPPPPPPDPDPGSPPAVPEMTAAGPVMDCIGPNGPMVCPPDPANKNGWWGKPRDNEDIYYNGGADANFQDALTGR
eukprot:gnl/MRDRNA2_/MRDRNA2_137108_c0_seq1.p1 gnl/MRDRNA2_/MRDRNA2_137108_c0~~gnl/MRDRNA2_/MRDRNA2_137108_c0_seq1.p1  ORF type:complete len:409 (-),score=73.63 gnl/MRDRNA2_/MRDRNA2_137108_c0_seq1:57-1283(-)